MKKFLKGKFAVVLAGVFLLSAIAAPQIKQILKVGGVLVVINTFGKEMNRSINKLWGREDNSKVKTKVVPILTVGKGTAIGAVQVMGPPAQVDKVIGVAQPEVSFQGIRLRALIPISDKNTSSIRAVEEVGVSGIVDIKL
jgi:hypothetical protein